MALERLGATREFGHVLLGLLKANGWTVANRPAIGGGRLVIASRQGYEIVDHGDTLAEVACRVFEAATRAQRLQRDENVQLELA